MSWIENSLARLESTLRAIIEGGPGSGRLSRKFHGQVLQALVAAMQAGTVTGLVQDLEHPSLPTAPDQYTLVVPVEMAKDLLLHPGELDRLARDLLSSAGRLKVHLSAPPMLHVVGNPTSTELSVQTNFSHSRMNDSSTTQLEDSPGSRPGGVLNIMPKAYLIVNGLTTFTLEQAVTNIGSHPGNHLVLDDPDVSPRHAQLRLVNNHFAIFDLDSKRGTFVNGLPVASQALNPGDVVLLASIPLVYGQELPARVGYTQELPANIQGPEVI